MAKREPKLLRVSVAAHELGLHPMTVRRWIKAGRIQVISVGREVRIPRTEVERLVGKVDGRLLVLYGRVSGHGQKDDLEIQLKRLQAWATAERKGKETLMFSDSGSGLKAGRRQLQRLLKLVCEDTVGEVAITSEDRLTRLGQEWHLAVVQGRHHSSVASVPARSSSPWETDGSHAARRVPGKRGAVRRAGFHCRSGERGIACLGKH